MNARLLLRAPRTVAAVLRLWRGRPAFASVNLLNRCNQACPMCAVHEGPEDQLPLDVLARTFRTLRGRGVRVVELSGGEPFLRRDLPAVIEALDRVGLLFTFNTNGAAVTDAGLAALAGARGLLQVAVSLDSLDRDRYRLLRGRDQLEQALGGLERLRRARLPGPVKLNVAVSRHNAGELGDLLDFAADRGLFLSAFPVNQGPGAHRSAHGPFGAPEAERAAIARRFEALARLRRRGAPLWDPSAFYLSAAAFVRGEALAACGAGALYLDLRADGAVAPCVELPAVTTADELEDDAGWRALAGARAAAGACQREHPCCYTCTIGLAEIARAPLAWARETALCLARQRLPRRRWGAALLAEESA